MYQKLQLNFFKIIIVSGLLFVGGRSFSQTPDERSIVEQETELPQEEHNTKDLEKLLKNYNTDQEKILEDTSKIHTIQEGDAKSEINEAEIEAVPSQKELSEKDLELAHVVKLRDVNDRPKAVPSDLSGSVRMALEPLQKLPEEELLKRFVEATSTSKFKSFIDKFPSITLFSIRLIKDKESIPSAVKILEDKDRLVFFGSMILFSIIFGVALKKMMHKEGRSFVMSVFYFFVRIYIMFAIRVGIVYYFYSAELTPAARIFKKTFL